MVLFVKKGVRERGELSSEARIHWRVTRVDVHLLNRVGVLEKVQIAVEKNKFQRKE